MSRRFTLVTVSLAATVAFLVGAIVAGGLTQPRVRAGETPARPTLSAPRRAALGPADTPLANFADIVDRVNPAVVGIDATTRAGEEAVSALRDLLLWWLAERIKSGAATTAPGSLDRWAGLWENTARLFERAEAASLDRKQALLEIFYDIQSTARAA